MDTQEVWNRSPWKPDCWCQSHQWCQS